MGMIMSVYLSACSNLRTAGWILIEPDINMMLLEATPEAFLIFLQSVITMRRTYELVSWELPDVMSGNNV
jgi:hypothetical protein